MIPLRLSLRNFLCYRDNVPTLELEGVHLACLSGNNGHGKSALLDALTWALWGRARAKSNDELIHLGRSEMEVQLDFRLGTDRFRVIRKYSVGRNRSAAGHTVLEFQQFRENTLVPITGNSIRETQAKIEALLRLDYDTFINSAFLLQGRADAFTLRTPSQRKEVLAQILGLSRYDVLADAARAQARQVAAQAQALAADLARLDVELAREPEYEAERQGIEAELAELTRRLRLQEEAVASLSQRCQGLQRRAEEWDQLKARLKDMETQLAELEAEAQLHRFQIASYQQLLAEGEAIAGGHRRFLEARQLQASLDEKLSSYLALKNGQRTLEQSVERARAELEAERRSRSQTVAAQEEMIRRQPAVIEETATLQHRLEDMERRRQELEKRKETLTNLLSQREVLRAQNRQLDAAIKEAKEKMALLGGQADERCPLCGAELGEVGLNHLETAYRRELADKTQAYSANLEAMKQQTREEESLRASLARGEAQLDQEGRALPGRLAVLERELAQIEVAASALTQEQGRLSAVEGALRSGDFATADQAELRRIFQRLAELGYDPQIHEAARGEAARWADYEERHRQLDEAQRRLGQEEEALARAQGRAQRWRSLLEADAETARRLEAEVAGLPALERDLETGQRRRDELRQRQTDGHRSLGTVLQKLESCRQMKLERKRQEERRAQARLEVELHEELAEAFGKKGIQALLIERALPELEAEANELLGRMTGHRMHLKLESQRQTRQGELAETLDIKINDELGLRSYELYSGGEAFRVNFALRVALSKLLARRAGAPLPILIIDEGFGTQDAQGRERLVEAIGAVADDFELILVITHIDELKDAFPVRIEVTKGDDGATFSMS